MLLFRTPSQAEVLHFPNLPQVYGYGRVVKQNYVPFLVTYSQKSYDSGSTVKHGNGHTRSSCAIPEKKN